MKITREELFYAEKVMEETKAYVVYPLLENMDRMLGTDLKRFTLAKVTVCISIEHIHPIHMAECYIEDDYTHDTTIVDVFGVNNGRQIYVFNYVCDFVRTVKSNFHKSKNMMYLLSKIAKSFLYCTTRSIYDCYIDEHPSECRISEEDHIQVIRDFANVIIDAIIIKYNTRFNHNSYSCCKKTNFKKMIEWTVYNEINFIDQVFYYEIYMDLVSYIISTVADHSKNSILIPMTCSIEQNFKSYAYSYSEIWKLVELRISDSNSTDSNYCAGSTFYYGARGEERGNFKSLIEDRFMLIAFNIVDIILDNPSDLENGCISLLCEVPHVILHETYHLLYILGLAENIDADEAIQNLDTLIASFTKEKIDSYEDNVCREALIKLLDMIPKILKYPKSFKESDLDRYVEEVNADVFALTTLLRSFECESELSYYINYRDIIAIIAKHIDYRECLKNNIPWYDEIIVGEIMSSQINDVNRIQELQMKLNKFKMSDIMEEDKNESIQKTS